MRVGLTFVSFSFVFVFGSFPATAVQALSLVVTLAAHAASVSAVAWSPDQRQLVSVGLDGAICVWNFYLD